MCPASMSTRTDRHSAPPSACEHGHIVHISIIEWVRTELQSWLASQACWMGGCGCVSEWARASCSATILSSFIDFRMRKCLNPGVQGHRVKLGLGG